MVRGWIEENFWSSGISCEDGEGNVVRGEEMGYRYKYVWENDSIYIREKNW